MSINPEQHKSDGTAPTNAPAGVLGTAIDLAGGSLDDTKRQTVNVRMLVWQHHRRQRTVLFVLIAFIVTCLFTFSGLLAIHAAYAIFKLQLSNGWHIWVPVVSFLFPPTVLALVLIKSVYARSTEGKSAVDPSLDDLPGVSFLKNISGAVQNNSNL